MSVLACGISECSSGSRRIKASGPKSCGGYTLGKPPQPPTSVHSKKLTNKVERQKQRLSSKNSTLRLCIAQRVPNLDRQNEVIGTAYFVSGGFITIDFE
jgi:hypothetical protein